MTDFLCWQGLKEAKIRVPREVVCVALYLKKSSQLLPLWPSGHVLEPTTTKGTHFYGWQPLNGAQFSWSEIEATALSARARTKFSHLNPGQESIW